MTAKPKSPKKVAKAPAKATPTPKKSAKKAAKPVAKPGGARKPHRPDPATLPGHHATKMEHVRHEAEADHAHQDPRWPAEKPDAKLLQNHAIPARLDHGAMKTRGIPRMNPMINWFRKAPKKKGE